MERDMGTTLATKQDLKLLEQQLAGVRTELKQEIGNRYELLPREIGALRGDVDNKIALVRKDMEALRLSMTLRLGSMLAVGVGVTVSVILGVLRLWL